ncbi:hypothetical protein BCR36DRAFT_348459 [Piromyces finnis]|uniref:HTH La-type RNA-binding domain-containing protein n=1 Tax=Piromyces finnis TaxID=1754191 RepID=A0A1Y1VEN2_9FUNG|nr:hypothetical protein BCR36DRAFT_348459 [Piromyces finnis]|eukprot:ORX54305.1 hypothetical protein BCR36DRAFT_348459 [Piromyces finnis]
MSKRNYYKKDNVKRENRISGILQKQPSFNSHQKLFFHTKQPYYTLQDKSNPDAPPTYQIYQGPTQTLDSISTQMTIAEKLSLSSTISSSNTTNITTLSSTPIQSQRPKNIMSELVVSTSDESAFQTKKSEIEQSLKLVKAIEDRFTENHLQHDKIFLSRINSYTNGYIPLLHLTAYSDISKYCQNNLEYLANSIETYSNQLELNPERTHVKRKGQGTALPLEELIENLVPTAKRTLVALNIDSTQTQKQQDILNQCRCYLKELEEEEELKRKEFNEISYHSNNGFNLNSTNIGINPNSKENSMLPLFIQHSVHIAYIENPRDYRNMFYKPEDLCKDIFEPMDSIAYILLEFDSEKTANYIYNRFENDRKKNNSNFIVKKRFRNFKKFNNNNNNSNGARNNNTNNKNNTDIKNKHNKHYNKNYQNSTKKDKNKFNRKSNSNFHYNHNNIYNNKINTTNINNNKNNNIMYNEGSQHKNNNYGNKNNHYPIDNNRKSFTTSTDTEIINNKPNIPSPVTSPLALNINNTSHSSLDINNNSSTINQIPSFMNPLNNFNSVFNISSNTSLSPSSAQSQNQSLINPTQTTQYSTEITSPTIHSGNSVNSGIDTSSLFNSPTFEKDYQKQQVFFQNNVQYNGKIYKLDSLNNSGYIQLSDEVISVLLNDTRNEGKSFELIKSYLVYFSYSDVEVSHINNMKVGDNVSFKVKMTFIASNSANSSPIDPEDNSITQAFDIFIKNKNNIPPDVLEMMKMMENIF